MATLSPRNSPAPSAEKPAVVAFRLYVSAASPISARAIVNVRRFLDTHFPGAHRLAVLNIAEHVGMARADQIIASPTLIRLDVVPMRRIIGDMSNDTRLRTALGVPPERRP